MKNKIVYVLFKINKMEKLKEYSYDAIVDMICNLSRFEGNNIEIKELKEILEQRKKIKTKQFYKGAKVRFIGSCAEYMLLSFTEHSFTLVDWMSRHEEESQTKTYNGNIYKLLEIAKL